MKRMSTLTLDQRNDLHLTSTGVGHATREAAEFPPSDFKTTRANPLPGRLAPLPSGPFASDVYQTTTGAAHDYKPPEPTLQHPEHCKAPGNWKMHYVSDATAKMDVKPWRRPLTTRVQSTEMRSQYQAKDEEVSRFIPNSHNTQLPQLADHLNDGPTKVLVPSTVNKSLCGRPFIPQNQAILDRLEPYMTTNNWHHRTFGRVELSGYPRKNVATYWQCEDYSKAWGHGTKENPLPRKLVRTDPGPMRDRTWFATATTIPRLPESLQPVMTGLRSVYADKYQAPTKEQRRDLFRRPIDSAIEVTVPECSPTEAVPHMYQTMNMTYGTGPAVVS